MADLGSTTISETASSNTAASPNGMAENVAPSTVNNTYREGLAAQKRFWNRINGVKTGGGTANAQTCNWDVAESAYYAGARALVKFAATNTAPASMNFNSLGAVTMVDAAGDALVGGEVQSGAYGELMHDGTNLRLLSHFYKTGTFTPTVTMGTSGSVTLGTAAGRYIRMGRLVHFWIYVSASSVSSPVGSTTIGGLPYAIVNSDGGEGGVATWFDNFGVDTGGGLVSYLIKNTTTIRVTSPRDNSVAGDTPVWIGSGSALRLSGVYETTA